MKILKIAGLVALALMVIAFSLRLLSGSEDAWLCQNGEWIKHGQPSAPQPAAVCLPTLPIGRQAGQAGGQPAGGLTSTTTKFFEVEVFAPRTGQVIKSPLTVAGRARGNWFFEASFPIKLIDSQGKEIAASHVQSIGDWMTNDYVPFSGQLIFNVKATTTGRLILKNDNPSGLPELDKEISQPVLISPEPAFTVKAFFNNANLDPEFSCNKVFSVERQIAKTASVARAALEELLSGPNELDKALGFTSSLNLNVKIQKLTIAGGTAKVDFNNQLEFQVGGSCRVSAIRAQITETLKQFSTVKNVIISINGRTENILQP